MGILSTHTDVWKCEIVKSNLLTSAMTIPKISRQF